VMVIVVSVDFIWLVCFVLSCIAERGRWYRRSLWQCIAPVFLFFRILYHHPL